MASPATLVSEEGFERARGDPVLSWGPHLSRGVLSEGGDTSPSVVLSQGGHVAQSWGPREGIAASSWSHVRGWRPSLPRSPGRAGSPSVRRGERQPCSGAHGASTHLGMEAVKGHDGPEEEEGQVEVVLEQVDEGVAAVGVGALLQGKAGAAQHCEAAAPLEQHLLKIKSACYKPVLDGREQAASSLGAPCLWGAHPAPCRGPARCCPFVSSRASQRGPPWANPWTALG